MRELRVLGLIIGGLIIGAGCAPGSPVSSSAAVSDPGVTTDAVATAGTATASADPRAQAVRFSECMRTNGVREFPDPDASGQLTFDGVVNGSSLDPGSAVWTQAVAACKDLQPAEFTGQERSAREQEGALRFAQCIRDNGVNDFPDPEPDGPLIDTNRIPSMAGKEPRNDPGLGGAMEACRDLSAEAGVKGP